MPLWIRYFIQSWSRLEVEKHDYEIPLEDGLQLIAEPDHEKGYLQIHSSV